MAISDKATLRTGDSYELLADIKPSAPSAKQPQGRPGNDRLTEQGREIREPVRQKTVLVTGANGFIGSNLVVQLSASGNETIAAVRPERRLRPEMTQNCPALNYREVQFGSVASLKHALEGVDTVVHAAGSVTGANYRHFLDSNRRATLHLLQAAAAMPTPPHIILLSSVAAAGPKTSAQPRRTDEVPEPISLYGRSKLAGERVARRFAGTVPITILRPGIVFGAGDREVLRLIKLAALSHVNFVPGIRQPLFPFLAVDDLVSCVARASQVGAVLPALSEREVDEAGLRGEGIYYAADPEFCSFAKFGRWISQALGQRFVPSIPLPLPALRFAARVSTWLTDASRPSTFTVDKIREANVLGWECDVTKTIQELNWMPAAPLEERLRQTIDWYRQHGWLGRAIPT